MNIVAPRGFIMVKCKCSQEDIEKAPKGLIVAHRVQHRPSMWKQDV